MVSKKTNIEFNHEMTANMGNFVDGLKGLINEAERAHYLEDILNNAITSLYIAQPNGVVNYSKDTPAIGKVWFNVPHNLPSKMMIEYSPSDNYMKKWNYMKKTIGSIDLDDKFFRVVWDEGRLENYYQIPEVLMKDTEEVMKSLGLKKK